MYMAGWLDGMFNEPILSLVAPCLNEQENVSILARRFFAAAEAHRFQVEVVFVDDGSTDLTWERIQALEQEFQGTVRSVRHLINRGIPQGWISGVELARGRFVCLIDSDLQNPPESAIEMLIAIQSNNVDLVRGVRNPLKTQPKSRVIMSKTLNWVLNFTFDMNSSDNKSGFLLGHRNVVRTVVNHTGQYRHYQTFVGVAAHSRRYSTLEMETPFEDRRSGISFLSGRSIGVILEVFSDIPEAQREFGSRFKSRRKP
jgi:phenylacetate-CoA ligase